MPTAALKHICHVKKNHFKYVSQNLKFYNIPEYSKKKNLAEISYSTEAGNIYIVKEFFIQFFPECPYIHDWNGNVLNESFPYNNTWSDLFKEKYITYDEKCIKYLDKAMYCALRSSQNYWHFVFTVLDQIYAMEKNGYDGKYILWNKSYIKELVMLLGINQERLVLVNENEVYKIKELHIIDNYCWASPKNPKLLLEMRAKILSNIDMSDIDKYPKHLYIRRIKPYARAVKNEAEVIEFLKKYKFSAIFPDDYSVSEQIKYFHAADIVVCPHGGCSTNALFMKPNSHFIECFGFNYINPCMLNIIKLCGIFYNMVVENGGVLSVSDQSSDYNINKLLLDDTLYKYLPDYSKA